MSETLLLATTVLTEVAVGIPNPGMGEAPPGSEAFLTVIKWAVWIVLGICVLGVIFAGARMAFGGRHGEGSEHASRLGWVFAGCMVVGSASGIVAALLPAAA